MGNGACASIAPEVFTLVNGLSTIKGDADPLDDAVRYAIAECPSEALSIEEYPD